jgi:hypothetical protein
MQVKEPPYYDSAIMFNIQSGNPGQTFGCGYPKGGNPFRWITGLADAMHAKRSESSWAFVFRLQLSHLTNEIQQAALKGEHLVRLISLLFLYCWKYTIRRTSKTFWIRR